MKPIRFPLTFRIDSYGNGCVLEPYLIPKGMPAAMGGYPVVCEVPRTEPPAPSTQERAAYIVRACNAFDAMREALEEAENDIRQRALPGKDWLEKARAALALANGETK